MSSITLEDANTVIAAAIGKARELGFNMAVAVVDLQTSLVASARMDGTNPLRRTLCAERLWRRRGRRATPSGVAASRFPQSLLDTVRDMYGGRVTWVQGAVPLYKDGQLIGAVGAGGGPPDKGRGSGPGGR